MKNVKRPEPKDRWGFPRVAYVYPSRRAAGYYATAVDDNGRRTRKRFFGQKKWGGIETAYEAARAFAALQPASARPTLRIGSDKTTQQPETATASDNRCRLAFRQFDLRPSARGGADWQVTVRAIHGAKRVRRFDVQRYGLVLALRNAAKCHVAWFERETGRPEAVGADGYVRVMRYVLDQHGLTPVRLTDLRPPADIAWQRGIVRVRRHDGRERKFGFREHGGRFVAQVAAVAWAIEGLSLITALPPSLRGNDQRAGSPPRHTSHTAA